MRATLLVAALFCSGSCARELEVPGALPPEPARPVLLGSLSGLYSLAIEVELTFDPASPPFVLRAPVPGFGIVMELAADDGSFDVATGGLLLGPHEQYVGAATPPQPCPEGIEGMDRVLFTGPAGAEGFSEAALYTQDRLGPERCTCNEAGVLSATRHAVGNGLAIDHGFRICPDSEPRRQRAELTCPFDPAISGLYAGTRTGGDGVEHPAQVALGFVDPLVYGIRYPEVTEVVQGPFERASGRSDSLERTRIPADCFGTDEPGGLTLSRDAGELHAELTLNGENPELFSLTRKAGGESAPCSLTSADSVGLRSTSVKRLLAGRPFLALTISSAASPGVPLLPSTELLLIAALHAPGAGTWLLPVGADALLPLLELLPEEERARVSLLLPLPALAAGEEQQYELVVFAQPRAFGAAPLTAAPVCLFDAG